MKKDFIMPVLVLTIICLVIGGALALTNDATAPIITAASLERRDAAMLDKIPQADGFEIFYEQGQGSTELYGQTLPASILEIYSTTNNVGYIFIAAVPGYSGHITVITAVDPNGQIIKTSTLSHTETQGIGTIIEKPSFLDTFIGRDNTLEGVDTVAGATVTTRAYIRAIQDKMIAFDMLP